MADGLIMRAKCLYSTAQAGLDVCGPGPGARARDKLQAQIKQPASAVSLPRRLRLGSNDAMAFPTFITEH